MRNHYKNSNGVLLVFDLTDKKSFENCQYWWEEIQRNCETDPKVILVGNKLDYVSDNGINRAVTTEEAKAFAQVNNMMYEETSALTQKNVKNAFIRLLSGCFSRYRRDEKQNGAF